MKVGGAYTILNVLGTGGFGTVYRARYTGEGGFTKEVAIKVLNPNLEGNTGIGARLRDEARMLGLVRHRAIVGVDRLLQAEGRWLIVMEYVEGLNLASALKLGPVPVGPALEIVAEVAGALNTALQRTGEQGRPLRLLHRDIKPANIQLTPMGEVKVLDFGIARAEFEGREGDTQSVMLGSPDYMSPERLEFDPGGPEADVYALGVVLYEMVSGERFGRSSPVPERHQARVAAALEPLRARPELDGRVVDLIDEAMAADPARRPLAAAFEARALALRQTVGGEMLRYWTERVVQPQLQERDEDRTADLGAAHRTRWRVLDGTDRAVEEVSAPSPHAEPRRRPAWIAAGIAGLIGLVALVGWALREPTAVAPVPSPALSTAAAPSPEPAPTVAPARPTADPQPPAPAARAAPAEGAAPRTSSARAKIASPPAQTVATPAPVEPAPSAPTATVAIAGDAERVELRGGGGVHALPGAVPPGSYEVWATFSGRDPMGAGALTVASGESLALRCDSAFRKCVPKR